ncbi:MAG: hypothetical protein B6U73_00480 [Desulfurococcales archaeon ex4484_204]|nr:MAG: hypothetical protein B6U73_00480 [Desulfurococcales archaeon ex4484_204]
MKYSLGVYTEATLSEGVATSLGLTARIYWLDVFYSPDTFFEEELREYAYMGATEKNIERVVKGRLSSRLPEVFLTDRHDRVYGFGAYALKNEALKPAVTSWRSNVKAKLPKNMRKHILLEASRAREFLVVLSGSLLSPLLISKLEKIFKRKIRNTRFYKGTIINDTVRYIDEKLRENTTTPSTRYKESTHRRKTATGKVTRRNHKSNAGIDSLISCLLIDFTLLP